MNTINLIFYFLISPIIIFFLKSIWNIISPSLNNTVENIFPEKIGSFEETDVRFKDFILENKIFSLTYEVAYGYIRCSIIDKDGSTFRTIYVIIDIGAKNLLIKKFKEKMGKYGIPNNEFYELMPFILENCKLYRFKSKLSDKEFKYHLGLKFGLKFTTNHIKLNIKDELIKIKNLQDNNATIRWNFAFIKREYRYEYQKMITKNWTHQTDLIPEKWFYVKYSDDWNKIRDEQVLYNIKN